MPRISLKVLNWAAHTEYKPPATVLQTGNGKAKISCKGRCCKPWKWQLFGESDPRSFWMKHLWEGRKWMGTCPLNAFSLSFQQKLGTSSMTKIAKPKIYPTWWCFSEIRKLVEREENHKTLINMSGFLPKSYFLTLKCCHFSTLVKKVGMKRVLQLFKRTVVFCSNY